MPSLPVASSSPGTAGHEIVVPNPWLFSQDGVENVRYWLKTNVSPDPSALWMLDDDYNEESLFVRHAYFLGANDPYKALKTTLKAEIDEEAWSSLYSDISRPFPKPKTGRIAVKVINHLGDEVMKVFAVG